MQLHLIQLFLVLQTNNLQRLSTGDFPKYPRDLLMEVMHRVIIDLMVKEFNAMSNLSHILLKGCNLFDEGTTTQKPITTKR